ncbi:MULTISPECIES: nuclear transport factor 2 family protein [Actinoallomurus]|uniref:nuclear transport factor 2 family protein n=1 Tax=Actinoallomurus TaxID=667113 RepID=UPI002093533A|nr:MULTISPECIES: nuclear transport factor 2 family protein [Actinoallomurus]MCO5970129.1 nuclear transport factor 2 family protein [Actinoallomurus soli]MCO5995042.1 nuclear transport factor 2 family protein [Actinoallomurus rhizosphaericola]
MSDVNELVGRYIDTWNEKDPAARRAAVQALWAEDGTYVDPLADVRGHDGIDAVIGAVQGQFPDFVFRLGTPVDAHHDLARFTWELGPEGGEALVVGFDVVVLAEDGRIQHVHGFLDKVPAA